MKSLFKACALTSVLFLVWAVGCKNKVPTSSPYVVNPPDRLTLVNFETPVMHATSASVTDWGSVNQNLLGIATNQSSGTCIFLRGKGGLDSFYGWDYTTDVCKHTPVVEDASQNICQEVLTASGGASVLMSWLGLGESGHGHVAHIFEQFVDEGNGVYPVNQVRIRVLMTGCYDISNFSGVKFDIMYPREGFSVTLSSTSTSLLASEACTMNGDIAPATISATGAKMFTRKYSADDATKRRFSIATAPTLPPGDDITCGACKLSQCRNNFGVGLSPELDGNWNTNSIPFTSLTQESGYGKVIPADFAGHESEVIWLQWEAGRNNNAGTCNVNYYLDNVVFY